MLRPASRSVAKTSACGQPIHCSDTIEANVRELQKTHGQQGGGGGEEPQKRRPPAAREIVGMAAAEAVEL